MAGVEKTIECFDDVGAIALDVIDLVKGGLTLTSIPKALDAVAKVVELAKDAPAALPELADLDSTEAAQIGAAAYSLVKKVLDKLAA